MSTAPTSQHPEPSDATDHAARPATAEELEQINTELAAMMNCPPAALAGGADRSLADPLVICGILGGKDVGKSTLINALAGRQVSATHEEVGAGTTRPMAYVHRDSIAAYRQRFDGVGGLAERLDATPHDADPIRNVVLVDLPDFDSDLPRHRETVRAVAPLLDRLVWVMTPRKIADREWVRLFSTVVKDRNNVHCVLNKADELLGDDAYLAGLPRTFVEEQVEWARSALGQAGCTLERERLFIAAADAPTADEFVRRMARRWDDPDWSANATDRLAVAAIGRRLADELARLRCSVLSPVDPGATESLKQANLQTELRRNAELIRRHFEMDDWLRRTARAGEPAYHNTLFDEAFGASFCAVVTRRLQTSQRGETELADELLVDRVEQWPILPVVFWPMRWLVRRLGARFAGTRWAPSDTAEDVLTVRGQSLTDRLRVYRSRLEGDHSQVVRRFNLASRLPSVETMTRRIGSQATGLTRELDDELLTSLNQAYRRPAFWKRWSLWAILLWFPFAQPLTEGALRLLGAGGKIDILGGLLQLVTTLGARHLLTSLVFVAAVYVALLAVMYARCVGQVRRARRGRGRDSDNSDAQLLAERLEELLVSEIIEQPAQPFAETAHRLEYLRSRLRAVHN